MASFHPHVPLPPCTAREPSLHVGDARSADAGQARRAGQAGDANDAGDGDNGRPALARQQQPQPTEPSERGAVAAEHKPTSDRAQGTRALQTLSCLHWTRDMLVNACASAYKAVHDRFLAAYAEEQGEQGGNAAKLDEAIAGARA